MTKRRNIATATATGILVAAALTVSTPLRVQASDVGYFLGGVAANRIMNNMRRRTAAEEVQAYNSSRQAAPVAQAAPAASSSMTPEQRIQQLDKLAAGGYITPAEYKAKKKAILDSM